MTKEIIVINTGIDVAKYRCCFEGSFYPEGDLEAEREKLRTNPDQIQTHENSLKE